MTTITPTKFFPPKTEGWSHNIKAADGYFYGCPEKLITLFTIGQPIDVEVVTKEKDGRTYRDIKNVIPNKNGDAAPAPRPAAPQTRSYGEDNGTAERIYVAGIVNNYMQHLGKHHGEEDLTDALVIVTRAARAAWSLTFGRPQG